MDQDREKNSNNYISPAGGTVFDGRGMVVNYRNVSIIGIGLDVGFLLIHSLMLLLFWHYSVWPMFVFNIFSVFLYILMPLLILKGQYSAFVQITHLEVVAHMTLAVYYVGWDSGFQIAMMGFNIFLAYAEYTATSLRIKKVHSLILCLISMFMYIGIAVVDHHHTPQYLMPAEVAYRLRLGWSAAVFIITIFFLQLFAYMASEMQRQLSEEALHDKLTGLHNRLYMNDRLERIDRSEGGWLAIADIDDFKRVNDLYGHNCGDYVLKTVASIIQTLEPEAEVCRWGGEEFLLAGKAGSAPDAVFRCLDDMRRRVGDHKFEYEGNILHMTVTVGAAEARPDESAEEWVNRADMKLYEGKSSGKNKVVI